MGMEDYQELDIGAKQRGTVIEDLSWVDKFNIRYINFFQVMFAASVLGFLLLILM